jgi:hypothetical protein
MTDSHLLMLALPYLMQAAAGAIGGNVTGMIRRTESWGPLLNTLLGAVGGLIGAQLLHASGRADEATALAGGNLAVLEGSLAALGGVVLALLACSFKQPD